MTFTRRKEIKAEQETGLPEDPDDPAWIDMVDAEEWQDAIAFADEALDMQRHKKDDKTTMSKFPSPFRASLEALMSAADRMDQSPNWWGKWEGMMLSAMIMDIHEIPCPDPAKIKDFGTWRSFLAHVIVLASSGDIETAKILMTEEEACFDPVQFKSWQRAA